MSQRLSEGKQASANITNCKEEALSWLGWRWRGMISSGEGRKRKKKKMCMVHPAQTTLITLWGAGCSQGQMDNTCFARADSEIVSIFECTDTAIKWTGVLGQLLRFRKRGGLDSASSLSSVQQGCTDNVLPWELARAERLLGTSFPPPVLCFAAAEPCCWPACSLP